MDTAKTQLNDFLNKCEEVRNCKFIMATTKIKDLLKSIVNSADLFELFNTVAANFDYVAAKQRCFVEADGVYGNSKIVLPDTIGDRLAFIFCLLVEFDRNDLNFNAFLQKYYPKDGSYYASYHLFCDEVIGSLEAIICDIYARELSEGEEALPAPERMAELPPAPKRSAPDAKAAASLSVVLMLLDGEKESVADSDLGDEEKEAALTILESLSQAVRERDAKTVKALTCGYNYLALYAHFVSEGLSSLFEALGDFVGAL